jgi:H+/Cl- antiporter ClcA
MGEVAKEYEAWGRKRGMSTPTAKLMEKTLWHGWPIYLGLGIFLGLNGYLLCIRLIVKYVRRYRQHLRKRKEYYYDKDLEAIPRDRLLF